MPPFAAIPRTTLHTWAPSSLPSSRTSPLVAAASVSGQLDDSFSTTSDIELFSPFAPSPSNNFPGSSAGGGGGGANAALHVNTDPVARIKAPARFNTLAWGSYGATTGERPLGVIAGGMENGEVALWDPKAAMDGNRDPLITRYENLHHGPVRGLDFSPVQSNLLASGATNGEIFIFDLSQPSKPFSPGQRSRSLDSITSLAWNPSVVHILASSSNTGSTVVWDLKSKREITALSYAGGGPTGLGPGGFGGGGGFGFGAQQGGGGLGGLGGTSVVKWHPENPTKLITASEDDHAPLICVWDLRNWKEPERVLTGHEKGVLSVEWSRDDADLILSSGKDGRTCAWSVASGEIVAEVTPSSNWSFDTSFCPSNPSIISTSSLDGTISLHSLQSTNVSADPTPSAAAPAAGADLFEQVISANAANYPTKSLAYQPKWLKRPASVAFGFGGKLVRISHEKIAAAANAAQGQGQEYLAPRVEVRRVVTAQQVVERAEALEKAATGQEEGGLAKFCDDRAAALESSPSPSPSDAAAGVDEQESWNLLKTLFRASAAGAVQGKEKREQLIKLLGSVGGGAFDRDELKARVEEAVKVLRAKLPPLPNVQPAGAEVDGTATPTLNDKPFSGGASEADSASEVTEPSLFGGADAAPSGGSGNLFGGSSVGAGSDDFFSQIGSQQRPSALPDRLRVDPHLDSPLGAASVAATIGSASSVASLSVRRETFKLYSRLGLNGTSVEEQEEGEDDPDRLVTQSLVLGDFAAAVELSLATERYADALLFALQSGQAELLQSAQKAYFARRAASQPYLRVLESIVGNDLADVVQNADLANWTEAFVVACTFAATEDEFANLVEQLGTRLEYQFEVAQRTPQPEKAHEWRRNAVLCYLAAGKLEKVVGVWIQQMREEEQAALSAAGEGAADAQAQFDAHATALQAFIEKVQVFQHAVGYVDVDLSLPAASAAVAESGARMYKLASLYERYIEYAELLAGQGQTRLALKYVAMTPADFEGSPERTHEKAAIARERVLKAGGASAAAAYGQQQQQQVTSRFGQRSYGVQQPQSSAYNPYGGGSAYPAPSNPLAQSQRSAYAPPPSAAANAYNPYAAPPAAAPAPVTAPYQPATVTSPQRNPYAPAPAMVNPLDDPYAPAGGASSLGGVGGAAAPAPSNPYAPKIIPPVAANPAASDPYAPANPAVGLPAPPPVVDASPKFPPPVSAAVNPPPRAKPETAWNDAPVLPQRKTPAPAALAANAPKPSAITSPFPNSSPVGTPGLGGVAPPPPFGGAAPGMNVPPPPPSRGANRTPAPGANGVPPPPMARQQPQYAPPPPASTIPPPPAGRILSPPPPSSGAPNPYAPPPSSRQPSFASAMSPPLSQAQQPFPPPPPQASQAPPPPPLARQQPQYAAPPPPRVGTPSGLPARVGTPGAAAPPPPRASAGPPPPPPQGGAFNNRAGTASPAPGGHGFPGAGMPPPPRPNSVNQPRGQFPPPPQSQQPGQGGVPPLPNQPQQGQQGQQFPQRPPQANGHGAAPPPPPPGMNGQRPPPPPQQQQGFPEQQPPPPPPFRPTSAAGGAPPPPPQGQAPPPPRASVPAMKYPPGDRSHIPPQYRPIFETLTGELNRLRQVTPPQQAKIVTDTEKRLNVLFDMLNNETISENTAKNVGEVCQAIAARNQNAALEAHLRMLTAAPTEAAPFQAALKFICQRMSAPQ
ncbi:hypothetical protein JCM10213_004705 [Rhodosporidiobolus nylandii]